MNAWIELRNDIQREFKRDYPHIEVNEKIIDKYINSFDDLREFCTQESVTRSLYDFIFDTHQEFYYEVA